MELDDFKSAWKILDARLAQQNRLQFELLRERKTDQARRNLRPLFRGQFMQIMLGIGLIISIPGFFVVGIAWLVLTILASVKANEGVAYRYPFALRLIK